jgi:hypothetical protein
MMKKINNNQGITMTELIISILVFSIIMMATTSIFTPMLRGFLRASHLSEANTIMDNVAAVMLTDLTMADRIRLPDAITGSPEPATDGENDIWINFNLFNHTRFTAVDGRIFRDLDEDDDLSDLDNLDEDTLRKKIFDEGFYRNYAVGFEWEIDDGLVILTIFVSLDFDGLQWERSRVYTVRPMELRVVEDDGDD